jgi:hypothetical protein
LVVASQKENVELVKDADCYFAKNAVVVGIQTNKNTIFSSTYNPTTAPHC